MSADPRPSATRGSRGRRGGFRNLRGQLQVRMMLVFGLGAFVLVLLVTTIAYFSARTTLLHQSVSDAEARAQLNARQVSLLANEGYLVGSVEQLLSQIDRAAGIDQLCPVDASVLYMNDHWIEDDPYLFGGLVDDPLPNDIGSVQRIVFASPNGAAEQVINDPPCGNYILVGYSIPNVNAEQDAHFFALSSTEQVTRTLHILLVALTIGGIASVVASMVLGRSAARRVLRPLRNVAEVASAIADGRLDSRIESGGSGDLAVLSSSFNQMADRLQSRIEHDTRFASDVSHELRSPLTTLATALSVIESRRDDLPERAQQALDLLSAEVSRFQSLVRDLLEISRLDAGSVDFQMSIVEVGELVRNALGATNGADVPLEIDPAALTRKLAVDKRRFERILTNLVDNAARHGGGAVRVAVEATGDLVCIAVEDEGPGVPEAERNRIFDRFARGAVAAGRRGRGGGSGLGLALVSEHVRLHGGRVWVEDRAGGGARFVVELPLIPPQRSGTDGEGIGHDPSPEGPSSSEGTPSRPDSGLGDPDGVVS